MVVFEDLFLQSNGQPVEYQGRIVQMVDRLNLDGTKGLRLRFESVNSEWRQGVSLTTDKFFIVNGQKIPKSIVLWQDTAPSDVSIEIAEKAKQCQIKNVWDTGDGVVHSWHNGAALTVEVDGSCRRYLCNDGHTDDDFDDLIFTVELIA